MKGLSLSLSLSTLEWKSKNLDLAAISSLDAILQFPEARSGCPFFPFLVSIFHFHFTNSFEARFRFKGTMVRARGNVAIQLGLAFVQRFLAFFNVVNNITCLGLLHALFGLIIAGFQTIYAILTAIFQGFSAACYALESTVTVFGVILTTGLNAGFHGSRARENAPMAQGSLPTLDRNEEHGKQQVELEEIHHHRGKRAFFRCWLFDFY